MIISLLVWTGWWLESGYETRCVSAVSWHCLNWWDQHWQHKHRSWASLYFITHHVTSNGSYLIWSIWSWLLVTWMLLGVLHPDTSFILLWKVFDKPINYLDIFRVTEHSAYLAGNAVFVTKSENIYDWKTKVQMITFDVVRCHASWDDACVAPWSWHYSSVSGLLKSQQSQDCKLFNLTIMLNLFVPALSIKN